MNNERLTLMWHPSQTSNNIRRSPQCVKVWIESGVYLNDGTFLLPKLTWSKVSSTAPSSGANTIINNNRTAGQPQHRYQQYIHSGTTLEKLDLLDICRIYPLTTVNRIIHPFVLIQKSFCIETQSDKYIFQTQTIDERDRIVYGLKLVVARLASLLMLRDIRAAEEFFGTIITNHPQQHQHQHTGSSNTVPGNAPEWTFISSSQQPNKGNDTNNTNTAPETTSLNIQLIPIVEK
jgi:hypothetical protein